MTSEKIPKRITSSARKSSMVISKDNINDFKVLESRRKIRLSTVRSLVENLMRGIHFETPIALNKVGNKYEILEGNHRMEAIREFLEKRPANFVEVDVHVYDNLTEDEKIEYYKQWNRGTRQSSNDFVNQVWNKVPILKKFAGHEFPLNVTPYTGDDSVNAALILRVYHAVFKVPTFSGSSNLTTIKFIDAIEQYTNEDYTTLKAFFKDYVELFGLPKGKSPYYTRCIMTAVMKIWKDNKEEMAYTKLMKNLRKLYGHPLVGYYHRHHSTQAAYDAYVAAVGALNLNKPTTPIKSDETKEREGVPV